MAIGASRMIHQRTFCTTASAERLKVRKGSACSPTLSVAMPTTMAMTRICRTLKSNATEPASTEPSMPSGLVGMMPVRKSSHEPVLSGAAAWSRVTCAPFAGSMSRPRPMPVPTASRAVTANHSRVCPARRAAPVTCRRFAMEATIARKTSGGTIARSRLTKEDPTRSRVWVSQLGSASVPPIWRATMPSTTPRTRPMRTCVPNETRFSDASTERFPLGCDEGG